MSTTPERFDYVSASGGAPPPAGWLSRHWKGALGCGCLVVPLLVIAFAGGIVYLAFSSMRSSDVYLQALDKARSNPQVVRSLGTPLEAGWWLSGSMSTAGDSGSAVLTIPISGPQGKAKINLDAKKVGGRWTFKRLEVAIEGQQEPIVLIAPADERQSEPHPRDF